MEEATTGGVPAAHWLLFQHPLAPGALEALVVSRELGVTWADERTLGWQPGVLLQGPLTEEELAGAEGLPEWVGAVYAALTPRERGAPIPEELQLPGSILAAFPDGEPTGVERETLETLEALARRLGGGVLSETGVLVVPEPRIDLLLFTSTWVAEEQLVRLLSGVADFATDAGPVLPPGIEVDGYGLVTDAPDGGVLSVNASTADAIPLALAGYGWATGAVSVYEFRHYPVESFGFTASLPQNPVEAEARVDAAAAGALEKIASAAMKATGGPVCGHLCDDDGFLVVLD